MATSEAQSTEERLSALEKRITFLEDQAAILQLIAAYGPAADSLNQQALGALWTDDACYDTDGYLFENREGIADLVNIPQHREYVAAGSAHIMSLPVVQIGKDHASAHNYSRVYLAEREGHRVARVSANKWLFIKQNGNWKISHRTNRRLTGEDAARALLVIQPDI